MCYDGIDIENNVDIVMYNIDDDDDNNNNNNNNNNNIMDMSVFDINVFALEPNTYGLSEGYCFCLDKYLGKDMIYCDCCLTWYHCECLGISTQQFEDIQKQQEWLYERCILKK